MERWDIYDEEKKLTGRTMAKNDWHMKPGEFHLTVLGILERPDGKILITKRVDTKAWAPGCWEISGGGAQAGETSRQAVAREIKEETGITVDPDQGELVLTYKRVNPDEGDNYFVDVYRFTVDFKEADIQLQTQETSDYMLADTEQIRELGEQGKFLHYHSIKSVFR